MVITTSRIFYSITPSKKCQLHITITSLIREYSVQANLTRMVGCNGRRCVEACIDEIPWLASASRLLPSEHDQSVSQSSVLVYTTHYTWRVLLLSVFCTLYVYT